MKRIRYIKDNNGNYLTREVIKTKEGISLRAAYQGGDLKQPTKGFIRAVGSDAINIELQGASHHKIKIKIKRALEELGAIFGEESRKARK